MSRRPTGTATLIRVLDPDGPLGAAWIYQLDPPPLGNRPFALIAQCEDSAALWEADSTGRITDAQPLFRSPNANVTELLAELGYNTPEPINPATLKRWTVVEARITDPRHAGVLRLVRADDDDQPWRLMSGSGDGRHWYADRDITVLRVLAEPTEAGDQ